MNKEIKMVEKKKQSVLSVRTRTSVEELPKLIGTIYSKICNYLEEIKQEMEDMPFVAYYNLNMEDLDVEIGIPVNESVLGIEEIKKSQIPEGKYVEMMYKGPYYKMEKPYNEMTQWIEKNGYKPKYISYEYYYNSPEDVSEDELLTKISMAIY